MNEAPLVNFSAVPNRGPASASDALTIYTAEAMAHAWRNRPAQATGFELDLGAVVACDSVGIQLLYAARRSAANLGTPLRLANISPAVRTAAASIGGESILQADPASR